MGLGFISAQRTFHWVPEDSVYSLLFIRIVFKILEMCYVASEPVEIDSHRDFTNCNEMWEKNNFPVTSSTSLERIW